MKRGLVLVVGLLLLAAVSEARIRQLSLSMDISVYLAHHDLRFNEKALSKRWLKKQIKCHFDENKKGCRRLPLLLRMYVAAEPSLKKRKAYAYKIKDRLKYSERKFEEMAWFLYLYCDDSSLKHLLSDYHLDRIKQKYVEVVILSSAKIIENLKSEDEKVVEQALSVLSKHPQNVEMAPDVFDSLVQISVNPTFKRKVKFYASSYLHDMGYWVSYGEDEQGKFTFGKITVHSGRPYLTGYLASAPKSRVWQYHAQNLTSTGSIEKDFSDSHLVNLMGKLKPNITEDKKKLAWIKNSETYKKSAPSLKFIVGNQFFMNRNESEGMYHLKQAFKEGNNAMKSAIVAKFNEHFPVDRNFWQELMDKSTVAERVMIERNKKQWDINVDRL
ncbi:hypothetical protein [Marinicella rhabdoformis]|uniref:hypothetical protein n=1 Tax=Marinicella rhabdoformis TaxID=2580566 RepID=UPI0012AEBB73|nr:hypothetical protein [Marinicella rhabdoformis]